MDERIKYKTWKSQTTGRNYRENLLDISLGSNIFDTTAKAQEQKQK